MLNSVARSAEAKPYNACGYQAGGGEKYGQNQPSIMVSKCNEAHNKCWPQRLHEGLKQRCDTEVFAFLGMIHKVKRKTPSGGDKTDFPRCVKQAGERAEEQNPKTKLIRQPDDTTAASKTDAGY